jgi:ABC-type antimicrobial peptide transport system permease subunit
MAKSDSRIGTQVKLPASVAFEVVAQGIRIRLGRSIVTMMGIVLGIAFLMAILAGEVIKKGVAQEEAQRNAARRMVNFLTAEIGPPNGRRFGVVVTGQMSPAEVRVVRHLRAGGAEETRIATAGDQMPLPDAVRDVSVAVPLNSVADDVHALLVVGESGPVEMDWPKLLARARNKVIGFSRDPGTSRPDGGIMTVILQRQLREEEQEKLESDERKSVFRRNWIVIISLVASVICISNAMLMSVTERFREIGTMKCLGALSSFIRQMFLIESSLMGIAGSVAGALAGLVFALIAYGLTYGFGLVFASLSAGAIGLQMAFCLAVGVVLSVLAAVYPARIASRMVPANALRTNV